MSHDPYEGIIETPCPYADCGAGAGMQCVVKPRGWDEDDPNRPAAEVRDAPHAARVRAADPEPTEEEAALVAELEDDLAALDDCPEV